MGSTGAQPTNGGVTTNVGGVARDVLGRRCGLYKELDFRDDVVVLEAQDVGFRYIRGGLNHTRGLPAWLVAKVEHEGYELSWLTESVFEMVVVDA